MSPLFWILLLVVLAAVGAYAWRLRTPAAPPPSLPTGGDDLSSLGLSAVRPATGVRPEPVAPPASTDVRSSRPSERPTERSTDRPTAGDPLSTVSEARPKAGPDDAYIRADSPLWPDAADAIQPLLRSLAVTLGGGAAVLRHEGDAYHVDALVGVPGARAPRPIPADGHPLHRVPQDTVLSILGPESRRTLHYYADPEAAVGQAVVRALAPPPARRVLLVADVPPGHDELADDDLERIARFGDLVAALVQLDAPEPEEAEEEDTSGDDPSSTERDTQPEDAEAPDESDASSSDADGDERTAEADEDGADEDAADEPDELAPTAETSDAEEADTDLPDDDAPERRPSERSGGPLPRAVVMQREMDAARDRDRPLAFALVTLMNADALLRDDPTRVARAQADLETRLNGAPVCGLEPFGDLILGVFLDADPDAAVAWANELADTELPILIGLAPSADRDPETVRGAATEALEAAYHQGGGLAVA